MVTRSTTQGLWRVATGPPHVPAFSGLLRAAKHSPRGRESERMRPHGVEGNFEVSLRQEAAPGTRWEKVGRVGRGKDCRPRSVHSAWPRAPATLPGAYKRQEEGGRAEQEQGKSTTDLPRGLPRDLGMPRQQAL